MTTVTHSSATGLAVFSTRDDLPPAEASTSDLLTALWTFRQDWTELPRIGGHPVDEQTVTDLLNGLPRCGSWEARGVTDAPRIVCDQPAHGNGRCTAHGGVS